jgi:hypothetical protein
MGLEHHALTLFTGAPRPPFLLVILFLAFFYKIGIYDPNLAYTIKPKILQSIFKPTLNPIP